MYTPCFVLLCARACGHVLLLTFRLWLVQIDKSHPIHVRNDNAKKRKKVGAGRMLHKHAIHYNAHRTSSEVPLESAHPDYYHRADLHCTASHVQAKMPEPQPESTPRFGPAAKAARAKEREEEKAKAKAQQKAAAKP